MLFFFFSSRRRHTRFDCDWSSDVCSSDLVAVGMSLIFTSPVVERLGTAQLLGGGAGRIGRVFRVAQIACVDTAGGLGHGAMGEGAARQRQTRDRKSVV